MKTPTTATRRAVTCLLITGLFLAACAPLPASSTSTPAHLSTATATQALIAKQTLTNSQALASQVSIISSDDLTPCAEIKAGEVSRVFPGTFLVGDIEVNNVSYYSSSQADEATVAFFERAATAYAPRRVRCYQGSIYFLNTIINDQFTTGCISGCSQVRMVVFRADGEEETQCYYVDGGTRALQSDGDERWCPDRQS